MKRLYSYTTEDPWEAAFISAAVALIAGQNGYTGGTDPLVTAVALDVIQRETIPLLVTKLPDGRLGEMTLQFAALTTAAMRDVQARRDDATPDA